MRRLGRLAAVACLALVWAAPADGHGGGTTGYAEVGVHGQTVRYALHLGLDVLERAAATPGMLDLAALPALVAGAVTVEADGRACAPVPGEVTPPTPERASVQVVVLYACAAPVGTLRLRDDSFDRLGPDHHTIATFEWPGGRQQAVLQPDRREARIVVGQPAAPAVGGAAAFFVLGIEHIVFGFDHLLFLLALILRGGRLVTLLWIVTAFTVAHSITLALSVFGLLTLPPRLVEPVIALSIAYVALENLWLRRAVSRRWAVSFLFGLVHGFGFAGVLRELELPSAVLLGALLPFNLGVEAGQALVLAPLLAPLAWLRRSPWERRAVASLSAVVLVAGLGLLVERTVLAAG